MEPYVYKYYPGGKPKKLYKYRIIKKWRVKS